MTSSFFQPPASSTWAAAAKTAIAAVLMGAAASLPTHAQTAPAAAAAQQDSGAAAAPSISAGQDFPADARVLSASELDARLRGKVYTAKLASGVGWRADYKASGYVFVNTTSGYSDSGKWRIEDGKVCVEYRGNFRSGCTEVRGGAQALYAKSSTTGDITMMQPD